MPSASLGVTGSPVSILCRKWKRSKVWIIQWGQNFGPQFLAYLNILVQYPHCTTECTGHLVLTSVFKSVPSKAVAWGMPLGFVKQVKGYIAELNTRNLHAACIFKMESNLVPPGLSPYFTNNLKVRLNTAFSFRSPAWISLPATLRTSKFTLSYSA